MGPGRSASPAECETAQRLGGYIAQKGYILLTGGVAHGVMDAASKGARIFGGLVVGVLPHKLPSETHPVSEHVMVRIVTTFGEGRNVINALSSDVVVAIGMCPGTATEIAFAVKDGKPVILLHTDKTALRFFRDVLNGKVQVALTAEEAIEMIERVMN